MKPVIDSETKRIPIGFNGTAAGAISEITVVNALDIPTAADVDVKTGTVVKAVYVELWVIGDAAATGTFYSHVEKLPSGITKMTYSQSLSPNDYGNKKNILYSTQGLFPETGQNPVPIMRQWIKIPKGKQRFGLKDKIVVNIAATVAAIDWCGLLVYKRFN